MISLDSNKSFLKAKALKGPKFKEDRDQLRTITGKIPIWTMTEEGSSIFDFWQLPKSSLGEILDYWDIKDIEATESAKIDLEKFLAQTAKLTTVEIPEHIKSADGREMKPYQSYYVSIDPRKDKIICAFTQGLGKSMAALLRAKFLGFKKLLIVCNKMPRTVWKTEVRKTYNAPVLVFWGNKKQRKKLLEQVDDVDIYVVPYSCLKEFTNNTDIVFDQIIIDEAHNIAHAATATARDVDKAIKKSSEAGLQLLSGTPILDKIPDLWNLVKTVSPAIAGNYWSWKNKYVKTIFSINKTLPNGKKIRIPVKTINQNIKHLQDRIAPILVRINRDDYVGFQDETIIETIEITDKQKDLYENIRQHILTEIEEKNLGTENVPTMMLRLLQAAEGAFNFNPDWKDSGKLEYIQNELDQTDEKVIIWSRFKILGAILHEKYKDRAVLYNGSVSDNMKKLGVWAFQGCETKEDEEEFYKLREKYPDFKFEPGEAQFFFGVLNIKSAIGINLQACKYQIFSSFDYSMTTNAQAADRIKRINTPHSVVSTKYLVSERTLEEEVLTMILNKYKDISEVLDTKSSKSYNTTNDLIRMLRKKYD